MRNRLLKPALILAIAFLAISLTAWPPIARLARAETLTIRKADYIAAVRIQGASPLRIITRHIMPMCLPSVLVRITLNMAGINVLSTMFSLQVQSSDVTAATLATGSAVTVNGAAYTVRDVMLIDDGVFSKLTLSK